ncbi:MAG: PilZ domain-containing protein [Planctomycetota bacterium]
MHSPAEDRRRAPRIRMAAPVKLRVSRTGRYLPARSIDLSTAGALVELDRDTKLPVGTTVRLAVQRDASQAVVRAEAMVEATVVRVADDPRRVALAFSAVESAASKAA